MQNLIEMGYTGERDMLVSNTFRDGQSTLWAKEKAIVKIRDAGFGYRVLHQYVNILP